MRRAHGCLRGPRPAPAVGSMSRRPGEDADEEVVLLAIDNAREGHALANLPEPRRSAALFAKQPQHAQVRAGRPEEFLHGPAGRPEVAK